MTQSPDDCSKRNVVKQSQNKRGHGCIIALGLAISASLGMGFSPTAHAQNTIYVNYPQKAGKVLDLSSEMMPSWLTIQAELRGRTEGQTSFNYGQDSPRVYELTRIWGSAEARATKNITIFGQFMDTHALGLPAHAVASNMRDSFDLRQGYIDVHGHTANGIPVSFIVGRKEMKFGSERIIGISDWTNNSRTWDGFYATIGDKNKIDLFSTSVVTIYPTSLDKHGAGMTFHGAYANLTTWVPRTHISPYVLLHMTKNVTSAQGVVGNQTRVTFGSEIEGSLPGHFDYMWNGSLQRGSYSSNEIRAGQTFGKLAYTFKPVPWQPRLGFEYDYATGNPHTNTNRISTYDQSYPSNHNAFGLLDLFGYENIRQERLNLDLAPTKNLYVLVQGEWLNLATRMDNVYSSSGSTTIKAPTAGFASTNLGQGIDASAKYVFHNYLVANIGIGHLFPDEVLVDNKHGASQTVGYFSLTYRFRVDKHTENNN